MKIRMATKDDIKDIAKLYIDLATHIKDISGNPNFKVLSLESMQGYVKRQLGYPSKRVYVAVNKGNIVGTLFGSIKNEVGHIGDAFVAVPFRNKGIMRKLESAMLGFFKECGVSFVNLDVLSGNTVGKKCWEALGYKTHKELMRKEI